MYKHIYIFKPFYIYVPIFCKYNHKFQLHIYKLYTKFILYLSYGILYEYYRYVNCILVMLCTFLSSNALKY